jgi:twitching motility protein PilI
MGEVGEVLHEPRCTQLPGVKPWVKGVANLRGRLLPIMDLCGFFGHELSTARKQRRVLVVEHNDVFAGCWWTRCSACSTSQDSFEPISMSEAPGFQGRFVEGYFRREQNWRVFSPFALARSPVFMSVAI